MTEGMQEREPIPEEYKAAHENTIDAIDDQLTVIRRWVEQLIVRGSGTGDHGRASEDPTYQSLITSVEELAVAAEELHMQNQTLINTRAHLEEENRKLINLFETAPDGYLVTDQLGKILEANQIACEQLNLHKDFLYGKPLLPFIEKAQRSAFINALIALRTGTAQRASFETRIHPRKAPAIDVAISAALNRDPLNHGTTIRWLLRSIAERRKYEARLYDSEMRFQSVFSSAGVGVAIIGLDGRVQMINPAMLRILGFPELSPVGRPFIGYVKWDERESWTDQFETIVSGQVDNRYLQSCLIGRAGEEAVTRIALSLVRSVQGKAEYLILVAENITDEKRMEQELIDVEGRLTDAAESERIHLAQDLHDGPLQDLYGIMYQIKMVSLGNVDATTYAELDRTQEMVQATIDKLRATTGGLRPPTLAHFGLERGIRAHIDTLGDAIKDMEVHLDLQGDDAKLPERTRNTLFRIYQQGIANVLRHAGATKLDIQLRMDEDRVVLSIQDNGVGFQVPNRWVELVAAGHYGLVGAAERAVSIGGNLQIRSRPGEGALVQVTVPRNREEQVQTERLSVLVASPTSQDEPGGDGAPQKLPKTRKRKEEGVKR